MFFPSTERITNYMMTNPQVSSQILQSLKLGFYSLSTATKESRRRVGETFGAQRNKTCIKQKTDFLLIMISTRVCKRGTL